MERDTTVTLENGATFAIGPMHVYLTGRGGASTGTVHASREDRRKIAEALLASVGRTLPATVDPPYAAIKIEHKIGDDNDAVCLGLAATEDGAYALIGREVAAASPAGIATIRSVHVARIR